MQEKCKYCGKRKGIRFCPALGGMICSRCCGEHRLIDIECPEDCPHLKRHEDFQRAKQFNRYEETWRRLNSDIANDERKIKLLLFLEYQLWQGAKQLDRLNDQDIAESISYLIGHTGLIEVPTLTTSRLGNLVWDRLSPLLSEGQLFRSELKEGFTRLQRLLEALKEEKSPRAFLQGLEAHIESILPGDIEQEKTGLILTPDDLAHSL
ncbi:MAG: hypothetical protein U9Q23_02680 [Candidatus Bipolaricaulota bacterium]|nr:hypothetical protein [Candidatus Bipolaricaulota bacterium]